MGPGARGPTSVPCGGHGQIILEKIEWMKFVYNYCISIAYFLWLIGFVILRVFIERLIEMRTMLYCDQN